MRVVPLVVFCVQHVQIELDLPRTFPRHPWLSGQEGQEALRAVLTAYAGHNPDVGYCQVCICVCRGICLSQNESAETLTVGLYEARCCSCCMLATIA